jgi:hypothetical protein
MLRASSPKASPRDITAENSIEGPDSHIDALPERTSDRLILVKGEVIAQGELKS